jgi:hypothetical protein
MKPRQSISVVLAGALLALLGAASLTNAAPSTTAVQNAEVRGIIGDGSVKGIIVFGYGNSTFTVSLHGLQAGQSYRVLGSTRPCRLGNTDAATIFGIIVYDMPNPFVQATKRVSLDQFNNLKSFRIFRIANPNIQIACTKAVHFVPGLPT